MSEPVSPGTFARTLIERRAAARRRRWIVLGSVGGAAFLVITLTIVSFFTPAFATKRVQISGVALLTEQEVVDAARVPMEIPLPRQDRGAIGARVRELAPVEDVSVGFDWPNTVEVVVSERSLSYQRQRSRSEYDWVDTTGTIFHTTATPEPGAIVATTAEDEQRLLADVATVVESLPDEVRGDVESVSAKAVDQINVRLTGKRTVVWGSAEESDLKAQVLTPLLAVEARTYDVSAPQLPTTR